jgi:hypothetical protein
MIKVILRTFNSISQGYAFLNQLTLEGHEPLQFSPVVGGCFMIVRVQAPTAEAHMELSEEVLKAYLGLNDGRTHNHLAVLDVNELREAFLLAQDFLNKGLSIHEIRNFKNLSSPGHLVVSHSDSSTLKHIIGQRPHVLLDMKNKVLKDFLGFSDITIN